MSSLFENPNLSNTDNIPIPCPPKDQEVNPKAPQACSPSGSQSLGIELSLSSEDASPQVNPFPCTTSNFVSESSIRSKEGVTHVLPSEVRPESLVTTVPIEQLPRGEGRLKQATSWSQVVKNGVGLDSNFGGSANHKAMSLKFVEPIRDAQMIVVSPPRDIAAKGCKECEACLSQEEILAPTGNVVIQTSSTLKAPVNITTCNKFASLVVDLSKKQMNKMENSASLVKSLLSSKMKNIDGIPIGTTRKKKQKQKSPNQGKVGVPKAQGQGLPKPK
ncbi:unnamed protein product [Ilex paraguariensis]|uniref:Uncharacterized protein n=1 Tax=Ilex paraguariensis TaxID=185542 RepID=A0ABC8RB12_9AQUA